MQNCWEFKSCGKGPNSGNPCIAASNVKADQFLGGENGGRACFYITGTACNGEEFLSLNKKWINMCSNCEFYQQIKLKLNGELNYFQYLIHIKKKHDDQKIMNRMLANLACD